MGLRVRRGHRGRRRKTRGKFTDDIEKIVFSSEEGMEGGSSFNKNAGLVPEDAALLSLPFLSYNFYLQPRGLYTQTKTKTEESKHTHGVGYGPNCVCVRCTLVSTCVSITCASVIN